MSLTDKSKISESTILRLKGNAHKVGTPASITVTRVDASNDVLEAFGTTVPTAGDSGFAKGCHFIKTDGGAGSVLYINEGTSSSASFNPMETSALQEGYIALDITSLREISSNDIPNTAADAGVLSSNTSPTLARVNGATDKALVVNWAASNVDEVQFPPVAMPPFLNSGEDITIHLLARMSGATDTPTIDVQVFDAIGDTEMGGATAALSDTLQELTVTIDAANISGNPLGFLNISLVPGAHGTDGLELYGAWIEFTRS